MAEFQVLDHMTIPVRSGLSLKKSIEAANDFTRKFPRRAPYVVVEVKTIFAAPLTNEAKAEIEFRDAQKFALAKIKAERLAKNPPPKHSFNLKGVFSA